MLFFYIINQTVCLYQYYFLLFVFSGYSYPINMIKILSLSQIFFIFMVVRVFLDLLGISGYLSFWRTATFF